MKTAIFGTGLYAQNKIREKNLRFDLYIDNDQTKCGEIKDDILILTPDKVDLEDYFIIIASSYFYEIEQQLNRYGLKRYDNYVSIDWILEDELEFENYILSKISYPGITLNGLVQYKNLIDKLENHSDIDNGVEVEKVDLICGNINLVERLQNERVNYVYLKDELHNEKINYETLAGNYKIFSIKYYSGIQKFSIVEVLNVDSFKNVFICHNNLVNMFLGGIKTIEKIFSEIMSEMKIPARGIVNVGVHEGQEIAGFKKLGFESMVLIEANNELIPVINEKIFEDENCLVLNYAITDKIGEINFFKTNNGGQSSSVLPLKEHETVHPDVHVVESVTVQTTTLDRLLEEHELVRQSNILYLDVQGAEYLILSAAKRFLEQVDLVCTEVNFKELYEGCKSVHEIDELMDRSGFVRYVTMCGLNPTWGDAVYINKKYLGCEK